MIGYVRGRIVDGWPGGVIIDVNGIGYEIQIPLSSLSRLRETETEVTIFTHMVWKEDSLFLYGFESLEARNMFRLLLDVSGVGPKVALNILSVLSAQELLHALATGEPTRLQAIHGIGKKTAARLCVDLKERAGTLLSRTGWGEGRAPFAEAAQDDGSWSEALSALTNLGYRQAEARKALNEAESALEAGASVEMLVKRALQALAKGKTGPS